MKRFIHLLVCLAAVAFTAGCGTVFQGTKQEINVNSEPPGATVLVKGVEVAITPAVISVSKKDPKIVLRFEKEGYQPAEVTLIKVDGGWGTAPNVFFFVPAGFAVDYIYGGAYRIDPAEVNAVLKVQKKFERAEF